MGSSCSLFFVYFSSFRLLFPGGYPALSCPKKQLRTLWVGFDVCVDVLCLSELISGELCFADQPRIYVLLLCSVVFGWPLCFACGVCLRPCWALFVPVGLRPRWALLACCPVGVAGLGLHGFCQYAASGSLLSL